ncbi:MAG: hypothetical protein LUD02_14515 [Tannerellaceae bacterium]|nr:hypothetical protein [Tannerellaceae bacterium]
MHLHDLGAVQAYASHEKARTSLVKHLFKPTIHPSHTKVYELEADRKLAEMNQLRDSIRIDFITGNMDKPAGQFLLTRLIKKMPVDSLRYFYRLIPVEMKKVNLPGSSVTRSIRMPITASVRQITCFPFQEVP